jgi:hypothetical protein
MIKKHRKAMPALLLAIVGSLALTAIVVGQSGGALDLSWSTIAGGGGESTADRYAVQDSTGQPVASSVPSTGSDRFSLTDGFWQVGLTERKRYLPLVLSQRPPPIPTPTPTYAPPCSASNNYCEHYDTCQTAYGPLALSTPYRAYPEDTEDYYYFELLTRTSVNVNVENYAPTSDNGTVTLLGPANGDGCGPRIDYYGLPGHSSMSLGPHTLEPGKYHVRVYTSQSFSTSERYALVVTGW